MKHSFKLQSAAVLPLLLPLLIASWTACANPIQHAKSSLDPTFPLNSYLRNSHHQNDGLPTNRILDIDQDNDGFIWLATFYGLTRYDGKEYKLYTQQHFAALRSGVSCIETDPSGYIFAITNENRIITYHKGVFRELSTPENTPSGLVQKLFKDPNGKILTIGRDGIFEITRDGIFPYSYPGLNGLSISEFEFDREGTLFVITNDSRLFQITPTENILISDKVFHTNSLWTGALTFDSENRLWFSNVEGTVKCWHNGKFLPLDASYRNDFTHHYFQADKWGAVWIGYNHGLARQYDGRFEYYPDKDDIERNYAQQFFITKEDVLLYTHEQTYGLHFLSKGRFQNYNQESGLVQSRVNSVTKAKNGEILVGTSGGISVIKSSNNIKPLFPETLHGKSIRDIFRDKDDNIWISTAYNTPYIIDPDLKSIHQPFKGVIFGSREPRIITQDGIGNLWIGTNAGLYRAAPDQTEPDLFTQNNGLTGEYILTLLPEADSGLWIGSVGGGLIFFDGNQFNHISAGTDLQNQNVFGLMRDQNGAVWAGWNSGVIRVSDGELKYIDLSPYIPSAKIFHIIEDGIGHFWLTCEKGIYVMGAQDLSDLIDGKISKINYRHYLKADGLISNSIRANSRVLHDEEGNIWFPNMEGLSVINTHLTDQATYLPKINIEAMIVDDVSYDREALKNDSPIEILPDTKRILIKFTAPTIKSPESLRYRHKLHGFEEWSTGSQNEIHYTNLSPGIYQFEVGVENSDGEQSPTTQTITFKIIPHFYETPLFYIAIAIILILLGTLINHIRLRHSKARQNELEKTVALRTEEICQNLESIEALNQKLIRVDKEKNEFLGIVTHDLKNPLAGIQGLTTILQDQIEVINKPHSQELLQAIKGNTEQMFELLNNLLDINRIEESTENLTLIPCDLHRIVRKVAGNHTRAALAKHIHLQFESPKTELLVHAYEPFLDQILDNLISNSIKYTNLATQVRIFFQPKETSVVVGFEDQGNGIPKAEMEKLFKKFSKLSTRPTGSETSSGLGLAIAKQFTEKMNGKIWCESEFGKGSTFYVEFNKA